MPVPAAITDLSTVAASNSPAGGDTVTPNLDNYLRAHASFIAQNYTDKAPKASPTFTGTVTTAAIAASGNVTAPNFFITTSGTGSSGSTGFSTASGPSIQYYGTATGPAGAMYFLTAGVTKAILANGGDFYPASNNAYALGGSGNRWSTVYGVLGDFSGAVTVGGALAVSAALGSSGLVQLTDTGVAGVNVKLTGDGGTTPVKYIRVNTGAFQIINDGYSAALLNITDAGVITNTEGHELGLRGLPSASVTTGAFVAADRGKCVYASGGVTVPNSTMTAGDVVVIYNNTAAAITITATVGTLRLAGTATTGNRTLAARGYATIHFISATEAVASGAGVT
jgi:hypothetical protein